MRLVYWTVPLLLVALSLLLLRGTPLEPAAPEAPLVRIGVVSLGATDHAVFAHLKEELAAQGITRVSVIDPGPAGSRERLPALVKGLLAQQLDLIVVSTTPATLAVREATLRNPIPVVFAPVNDPVGSGIVDNLRHPGGHFTGVSTRNDDPVRLAWLIQVAPHVKRVYIPYSPADASSMHSLLRAREAAALLGLELLEQAVEGVDTPLRIPSEAQAVFVPRDGMLETRIGRMLHDQPLSGLPVVAPNLTLVEQGALLTYGFTHQRIGALVAHLVAQILRGVSPADLPVEQVESNLAINLESARRVGLVLNEELLRQAHIILP